MAVKDPNVLDKVEVQINASFQFLNECLYERRKRIISQYRDRRDKRRAAVENRKEILQQLYETKLDLQSQMENNNKLHSMLAKMVDDIDAKMKLLELENDNENIENLLFEYEDTDLKEMISQFGKICGNNIQQVSLHGEASQTVGLSHRQKEDIWEIDKSSLKLKSKLGAGQFREIWEGVWTNKVAVKILLPGTMSQKDFLTEANIMKKLQHKNVIKYFGVCTIEEPIYIVTEYMAKGSLLEFLKRGDGAKMKEQELVYIGAQVAAGMAHLGMHHYIHRKLAARSVLVGDANQIKVADFRLARVIDEEGIYEEEVETKFAIKWTAPEALYNNIYCIKSDVWSFGILLMEIITLGKVPYSGIPNQEVLQRVEDNYRMPKPQNCPDYLYQIMLDCWNANADARPTFENLKYQLEDFYVAAEMRYKDLNQ